MKLFVGILFLGFSIHEIDIKYAFLSSIDIILPIFIIVTVFDIIYMLPKKACDKICFAKKMIYTYILFFILALIFSQIIPRVESSSILYLLLMIVVCEIVRAILGFKVYEYVNKTKEKT